MTRWIAATLLVVAMLAAPSAGQAQAPMQIKGATTVDAEKIIALIDAEKDLVILDNRRAEDFNAGHIDGAKRILDTDLTEAKMAELVPSKSRPVLCYCNGLACGRAAKATQMAVEWGYSRVYYYALGMDEWKQLGLPLTTAQ
ncbi:MAG: rhodanese-like domain-containing protein [Alphaproteobacteria bacterium]